jgi:hypothetical protein
VSDIYFNSFNVKERKEGRGLQITIRRNTKGIMGEGRKVQKLI